MAGGRVWGGRVWGGRVGGGRVGGGGVPDPPTGFLVLKSIRIPFPSREGTTNVLTCLTF